MEVSYDDGRTWRPARVDRNGPAWTVHLPAGAPGDEFAALRTAATDQDGNTVTETLIRAFRLTRP